MVCLCIKEIKKYCISEYMLHATTRYETIHCLLANLNNIKGIHPTRWIVLPLLYIPRVNNIPTFIKLIKNNIRNCK